MKINNTETLSLDNFLMTTGTVLVKLHLWWKTDPVAQLHIPAWQATAPVVINDEMDSRFSTDW